MIIKKEYDVKSMIDTLEEEIKESKKFNGVVKLNIYTAFCILDVLQETLRREQRHQTLESAVTFVEKEDGTQTNLLEEHKEPSCFGEYGVEEDWDCTCELCEYEKQCKEMSNKKKKDCFGSYGNNDTWEVCKECDCEHDCMFATNVRNKMEVKEKEGRANE